jgi:hypothetical protein
LHEVVEKQKTVPLHEDPAFKIVEIEGKIKRVEMLF